MKKISFAILVLIFNLSLSSASSELGFLCSAKVDGFGGSFKLETVVEGYLVKNQDGAVLDGYDFKYKILDGRYVWAEADVRFDTKVENDPKYNPRRYINHYKFDLSKNIFGFVDFLVPFDAFNSIDDRYG